MNRTVIIIFVVTLFELLIGIIATDRNEKIINFEEPISDSKLVTNEQLPKDDKNRVLVRLKRKVYSWYVDANALSHSNKKEEEPEEEEEPIEVPAAAASVTSDANTSKIVKPIIVRPTSNGDDSSTINNNGGIIFSYSGAGDNGVDSSCLKNGKKVKCPTIVKLKKKAKIEAVDDGDEDSDEVSPKSPSSTSALQMRKWSTKKPSNKPKKSKSSMVILPHGVHVLYPKIHHIPSPLIPSVTTSSLDKETTIEPQTGCLTNGEKVPCTTTQTPIHEAKLNTSVNESGEKVTETETTEAIKDSNAYVSPLNNTTEISQSTVASLHNEGDDIVVTPSSMSDNPINDATTTAVPPTNEIMRSAGDTSHATPENERTSIQHTEESPQVHKVEEESSKVNQNVIPKVNQNVEEAQKHVSPESESPKVRPVAEPLSIKPVVTEPPKIRPAIESGSIRPPVGELSTLRPEGQSLNVRSGGDSLNIRPISESQKPLKPELLTPSGRPGPEATKLKPPGQFPIIRPPPESSNVRPPPGFSKIGPPSVYSNVGPPPVFSNVGPPPVSSKVGPPPVSSNVGPPSVSSNVGPPPVFSNVGSPPVSSKVGPPSVSSNVGPPSVSSNVGPPSGFSKIGPPPVFSNVGSPPSFSNNKPLGEVSTIRPSVEPLKFKSALDSPKVRPGIETSNVRPGIETSNVRPGIETSNVRPGIETSNVRPGIETSNVRPGIETSNVRPSVEPLKIRPVTELPNVRPMVEVPKSRPITESSKNRPLVESPKGRPVEEPLKGRPVTELPKSQPGGVLKGDKKVGECVSAAGQKIECGEQNLPPKYDIVYAITSSEESEEILLTGDEALPGGFKDQMKNVGKVNVLDEKHLNKSHKFSDIKKMIKRMKFSGIKDMVINDHMKKGKHHEIHLSDNPMFNSKPNGSTKGAKNKNNSNQPFFSSSSKVINNPNKVAKPGSDSSESVESDEVIFISSKEQFTYTKDGKVIKKKIKCHDENNKPVECLRHKGVKNSESGSLSRKTRSVLPIFFYQNMESVKKPKPHTDIADTIQLNSKEKFSFTKEGKIKNKKIFCYNEQNEKIDCASKSKFSKNKNSKYLSRRIRGVLPPSFYKQMETMKISPKPSDSVDTVRLNSRETFSFTKEGKITSKKLDCYNDKNEKVDCASQRKVPKKKSRKHLSRRIRGVLPPSFYKQMETIKIPQKPSDSVETIRLNSRETFSFTKDGKIKSKKINCYNDQNERVDCASQRKTSKKNHLKHLSRRTRGVLPPSFYQQMQRMKMPMNPTDSVETVKLNSREEFSFTKEGKYNEQNKRIDCSPKLKAAKSKGSRYSSRGVLPKSFFKRIKKLKIPIKPSDSQEVIRISSGEVFSYTKSENIQLTCYDGNEKVACSTLGKSASKTEKRMNINGEEKSIKDSYHPSSHKPVEQIYSTIQNEDIKQPVKPVESKDDKRIICLDEAGNQSIDCVPSKHSSRNDKGTKTQKHKLNSAEFLTSMGKIPHSKRYRKSKISHHRKHKRNRSK